jgi:hypothetical protein
MGQFSLSKEKLSFDQLLKQEKGDRDRAAKRFNAQKGGPVSSAYRPEKPATPSPEKTAAVPTPKPAATPDAAPTPTPRPLNLPDISRNPWETPNTAKTTGLPDLQTNPYESQRDKAVRPEQGVVTSDTSGGVKGAKGGISDYGSANRGAQGVVKPVKRVKMLKPRQFTLR